MRIGIDIDNVISNFSEELLNEYMLHDKKLNKDFIETIAGQWKRLNIETVKEAMEICKKEHKKVLKNNNIVKETNKKIVKNNNINTPEWFDNNFESNKENLEELEEILKDFD